MSDYPKGTGPDERERQILAMAARQADDVERLERSVKKRGAMVVGSQGQPVVNPATIEARQGRLAITRFLGELAIPDDEEEPMTAAQRRGRYAANVRHLSDQRKRQRGRAVGAQVR